MNLLEKAGRDRTQVGARSTAGDPDTRVVDKGSVTTAILTARRGRRPGRLGSGAAIRRRGGNEAGHG